MAPATVMVISTIGTPPRLTDSAAKCASSAEDTLIAGTMPISLIRAQTSILFMMEFLPVDGGVSFRGGQNTATAGMVLHPHHCPNDCQSAKYRIPQTASSGCGSLSPSCANQM